MIVEWAPLKFYSIFLLRFLYWHSWGWPTYRPKHVAYVLCCVGVNKSGLFDGQIMLNIPADNWSASEDSVSSCKEESPSGQVSGSPISQQIPPSHNLWGPKFSLPSSQQPATCLYCEPKLSSRRHSVLFLWKSTLILFSCLPSYLFLSSNFITILYVFLFFSINATYLAHLILLDLITWIIFGGN